MTTEELAGWGRVKRARGTVLTPDTAQCAAECLGAPKAGGLIAHGGGRSYGDAALNGGGHVIRTSALDRILAFDTATGAIEVEPGVTFRQILTRCLPLGFLPPVVPGTGFATIGGGVAMDVHGKNHESAGSFGQHVTALDLATPGCAPRTIGPDCEPELFRATCGGIGLTGMVTRIAFRLKHVPGPAVLVREQRAADLGALLAAMAETAGASYSVAWIDGTARGSRLGRGILETAEPAAGDVARQDRSWSMPCDVPGPVLNPVSVAAFNAWYFRRIPRDGRSRLRRYEDFLTPLDAVGYWNRIYGRRGFYQFQAVLPFEAGEAGLAALLEMVARSRQASFLAVLKRMGPGRAGHLSFPMAGTTLALDFPARPGVTELHAGLVAITRQHGGRVYLAKDALLEPEDFRAMYPEHEAFRRAALQADPQQTLQSDMSRRMAVTGDWPSRKIGPDAGAAEAMRGMASFPPVL